ncbi:hypothetical protein E2542_SST27684 [Spatholobus suberectus]|nr:hypothetical protein E2542_SST27684 [Spatholobus suberectus]
MKFFFTIAFMVGLYLFRVVTVPFRAFTMVLALLGAVVPQNSAALIPVSADDHVEQLPMSVDVSADGGHMAEEDEENAEAKVNERIRRVEKLLPIFLSWLGELEEEVGLRPKGSGKRNLRD